jgi:hypothetical protein
MRKAYVLFGLSIALLLLNGSEALCSVGGITGSSSGIPCDSAGTLYENLTTRSIDFEMLLNIGTSIPAFCASVTVSWTDAQQHPQSVTVNLSSFSPVVASSLPPGGTISWKSAAGASLTFFSWQLQRGQAANLSGTVGGRGVPCTSTLPIRHSN